MRLNPTYINNLRIMYQKTNSKHKNNSNVISNSLENFKQMRRNIQYDIFRYLCSPKYSVRDSVSIIVMWTAVICFMSLIQLIDAFNYKRNNFEKEKLYLPVDNQLQNSVKYNNLLNVSLPIYTIYFYFSYFCKSWKVKKE